VSSEVFFLDFYSFAAVLEFMAFIQILPIAFISLFGKNNVK